MIKLKRILRNNRGDGHTNRFGGADTSDTPVKDSYHPRRNGSKTIKKNESSPVTVILDGSEDDENNVEYIDPQDRERIQTLQKKIDHCIEELSTVAVISSNGTKELNGKASKNPSLDAADSGDTNTTMSSTSSSTMSSDLYGYMESLFWRNDPETTPSLKDEKCATGSVTRATNKGVYVKNCSKVQLMTYHGVMAFEGMTSRDPYWLDDEDEKNENARISKLSKYQIDENMMFVHAPQFDPVKSGFYRRSLEDGMTSSDEDD